MPVSAQYDSTAAKIDQQRNSLSYSGKDGQNVAYGLIAVAHSIIGAAEVLAKAIKEK